MQLHNLRDVWNDAGTVFTALKLNVTDTASNASSMLLDLQLGGSPVARVFKDGRIWGAHNGSAFNPGLELATSSDTTIRLVLGMNNTDTEGYIQTWNDASTAAMWLQPEGGAVLFGDDAYFLDSKNIYWGDATTFISADASDQRLDVYVNSTLSLRVATGAIQVAGVNTIQSDCLALFGATPMGTNGIVLMNGSGATNTGGGFLYTNAGALHYVGSSGTDTAIAPA